jgi:sortase B
MARQHRSTSASAQDDARCSGSKDGSSSRRPPLHRREHPGRVRLAGALIISGVLLCVVALVWLATILYGYWDAQQKYDSIAETSTFSTDVGDAVAQDPSVLGDVTIDWSALSAINADIVGWIYVPGTDIDYPIVQTDDNEYYLTHNFDGTSSSSGAVFLDYEDSGFTDQQVIVYGHHMKNGSMFAALVDFDDQTFFDGHRTIIIATPTKNYLLETAYVFVCSGDAEIRQIDYPSLEDLHGVLFEQYNEAEASSSTLDVSTLTQVFQFVTCSYETNDSRTVLTAYVVQTAEVDSTAEGTTTASTPEEGVEAIATEMTGD